MNNRTQIRQPPMTLEMASNTNVKEVEQWLLMMANNIGCQIACAKHAMRARHRLRCLEENTTVDCAEWYFGETFSVCLDDNFLHSLTTVSFFFIKYVWSASCSAYFVEISPSPYDPPASNDSKSSAYGTMRTCKMCHDHLAERGLGVMMRATDLEKKIMPKKQAKWKQKRPPWSKQQVKLKIISVR